MAFGSQAIENDDGARTRLLRRVLGLLACLTAVIGVALGSPGALFHHEGPADLVEIESEEEEAEAGSSRSASEAVSCAGGGEPPKPGANVHGGVADEAPSWGYSDLVARASWPWSDSVCAADRVGGARPRAPPVV
jgi:hypothetical protein